MEKTSIEYSNYPGAYYSHKNSYYCFEELFKFCKGCKYNIHHDELLNHIICNYKFNQGNFCVTDGIPICMGYELNGI